MDARKRKSAGLRHHGIYYDTTTTVGTPFRSTILFKIPRPGQLDVYTSILARLNANTPFRSALGNQLNTGQRRPSLCSVLSLLHLLTSNLVQVENM